MLVRHRRRDELLRDAQDVCTPVDGRDQRIVIVLAQKEANLGVHEMIRTKHLLLGLLGESEEAGESAFGQIGISSEQPKTRR
jgi:hypothetical protein